MFCLLQMQPLVVISTPEDRIPWLAIGLMEERMPGGVQDTCVLGWRALFKSQSHHQHLLNTQPLEEAGF